MKIKLLNLLLIGSLNFVDLQGSSNKGYQKLTETSASVILNNVEIDNETNLTFDGEGLLLRCSAALSNPSEDKFENINRIKVVANHLQTNRPKTPGIYWFTNIKRSMNSKVDPVCCDDYYCNKPTIDDESVVKTMVRFQKDIHRLIEKNRLILALNNPQGRIRYNQILPMAEIVPQSQSMNRVVPSAPVDDSQR